MNRTSRFLASQLISVPPISSIHSDRVLKYDVDFTSKLTRRCPSFNFHRPRSTSRSRSSKDKAPGVPAVKTFVVFSPSGSCFWSCQLMYSRASLKALGPMFNSSWKFEVVARSDWRKMARGLVEKPSVRSRAMDTHFRPERRRIISESSGSQSWDRGSGSNERLADFSRVAIEILPTQDVRWLKSCLVSHLDT